MEKDLIERIVELELSVRTLQDEVATLYKLVYGDVSEDCDEYDRLLDLQEIVDRRANK